MDQQIFYDPERKRWKRLRRILDTLAVLSTLILISVTISVLRRQALPELLLPQQKRNYRPLNERAPLLRAQKNQRPTRRHTHRRPSDIPFNTDEGLRAAYYEQDDPAGYSSFKAHIHQIDLLFPTWIQVSVSDGSLKSMTMEGQEYNLIDSHGVHDPDEEDKIKKIIFAAKEDTEIFPLVSNYSLSKGDFDQGIGALLKDAGKRAQIRSEILRVLAVSKLYRGISLDFEDVPDPDFDAYMQFVKEMYSDLRSRNLRLYVNVEVSAEDDELRTLATNSDGILLMNYDQHQVGSDPGPVAAQDWFVDNLKHVLKIVPKDKVICALGNYGYDWTTTIPDPKKKHAKVKTLSAEDVSVQEAWQSASDSEAEIHLDDDSLNPHFAYDDEDQGVRHQVWFLDGVTVLNELRAARQLGIKTFALWRLGEEDRSLWAVWDHPMAADAPQALSTLLPGQDVDTEGEGDILRVASKPQSGKRTVEVDTSEQDPTKQLITDESVEVYPHAFTVRLYGYQPKKLALSFDDGPDPTWTPKILDVLKQYQVKAAFMMIGSQAIDHVALMKRVVAEGHEIGNHTFTHPDISEISSRQLDLELNLTERLFAAKLGIQPLYFRPPYSIDQAPDTDDQASPALKIQNLGYIIVGDQIDTNDWQEHPRKSPQEITNTILYWLDLMKTKPQFRGSIILMHDGGGDRSATVAALPTVIETLRAKGYEFVPVSELMGKTTAQVMPPLSPQQRWQARVDSVAFFAYAFFTRFVVVVFYVGDVLMSARLILVGIFALIERLRRRKVAPPGTFEPSVAVVIPAYNEEKVIARTIQSVLNSDYKNLHVIVVDDGSKDRTYEVAQESFPVELASGKLRVLRKQNAGKALALNYALEHLQEDFYVGIDADTVIASDAVSKLMAHFIDEEIGAVAGNAKVGNRVNLWTRWQALEYITSQNFERRALDLFDVVTVVPGAIGAWRTKAVRAAGGYPVNTVAEDADLTMNLLEHGYKVIYEDKALAFTEAPINANGLMRQRFRWSFGTLQAVFKHKAAFMKNKAMGFFALPNIVIFQMLLPLVSPFIDLMFVAGTVHYLLDRHFHPGAANVASFEKLVTYFLAFLIIDFITSALAFSLERRHPASKGDGWLLFHIWLQRFAYRQVFSLVLLKTLKRAIDGRPFNWDKLERTAKMSPHTEQLTTNK